MAGPEVDGVLGAGEVAATVDAIAAVQQPDGMIPWWEGGHADPWNHVEAAMALDVGGRRAAAERAYDWLAATQRSDGAWHQYYVAGRVEDPTLDANVCAYVATGAWHHWRCTGDRGFVDAMWPVVERAVDWVLDLQQPGGEILWARHPDGTPWTFALLTGSSSIAHSLGCAVALAEVVGAERPDWELSAALLADAVASRPHAFAPKDRWAMDWYYPVLSGVLRGPAATARLASRRAEFVLPGAGVRCVADRPWATAAETSECALAHLAVGERATAVELFTWAQGLRDDDGAYFTGIVLPEMVHFPGGERSTYTAAAVVLAADALDGRGPAADLFTAPGERPAPADVADLDPAADLDDVAD